MQLFTTFHLVLVSITAPRTVTCSLVWMRASKRGRYPLTHALFACASLLLCVAPARAFAQQETAALGADSGSLPDAPVPQSAAQSLAERASSPKGSASVSGTVLDASGAAIPGAQVSLTRRDGARLQTVVSGASGDFTFTALPPGSYLVIVDARGFGPFTSAEFDLAPAQSYEIPGISLTVASATTEVMVRPTEVIAAEQIKAEEKQRILAVFPNFYVSYVRDAAPLTTRPTIPMPDTGEAQQDTASDGQQSLAMGVQPIT
jgi:hypothetical protein